MATVLTAHYPDDNEIIPARFLTGNVDRKRGDLRRAFEAVQDRTNWKNPIRALVALTAEQKAITAEAITFFAGCTATFEDRGVCNPTIGTDGRAIGRREYRVEAVGYYQAVGA